METNKQVVLNVLKGAFIERDATVVDRYFSPDYVQHNPRQSDSTLKTLSYEIGMVVVQIRRRRRRPVCRLGSETPCHRRYLQSEGRQSR